MSLTYAQDLWDRFEVVRSHQHEQRKTYEEVVSLLEDRANLEDSYYRQLEKINLSLAKHIVSQKGNLANLISGLKSDQAARADQAKNLAQSIRVEVVEKAKTLLEPHTQTSRNLSAEGKRLEKDLKTALDSLEKAKSRYQKTEKEVQGLEVLNEIMIAVSDYPYEKKQKHQAKIQQQQRELLELEQVYRQSTRDFNQFIESYQQEMKSIMSNYQKQQEERTEMLKDCVTKILIFETSVCRNLQYDIDSIINQINLLNMQEGLQEYIRENAFSRRLYEKQAFEQQNNFLSNTLMTLKNKQKDELTREKELINEVLRKMELTPEQLQLVHLGATPTEDGEAPALRQMLANKEQNIALTLLQVFIQAYKGEQLTEQLLEQFKQSVQFTRKSRRVWIAILEKARVSSLFKLSKGAYKILVKLCFVFLDTCDQEKDNFCSRKLLTLMLTFYKDRDASKNVKSTSQSKKFLSAKVCAHPLWRNRDFWESLLIESVIEELSYQKRLYSSESMEDLIYREKNIVYGQLAFQSQNMLIFGMQKREVREIVLRYAQFYNLNEQQMKELTVVIDGFVPQPNKHLPPPDTDVHGSGGGGGSSSASGIAASPGDEQHNSPSGNFFSNLGNLMNITPPNWRNTGVKPF